MLHVSCTILAADCYRIVKTLKINCGSLVDGCAKRCLYRREIWNLVNLAGVANVGMTEIGGLPHGFDVS
jgi:hypothetical protein